MKYGTMLLKQVMAASAIVGQGFRKKEERKPKDKNGRRIKKPPYKPGDVGLSYVSEFIRKDYGTILSRRERKALAKEQGKPFVAYYNGR